MADPRKVFVVYGRNNAARRAVFDFIRAIDLRPLEWNEVAIATGSGAPFIFEILEKGFELAQAIIIILTPDELVTLRPELQSEENDRQSRYQPRPNVFFEAGMAFMRDRHRTILIEFGSIIQASDLQGIHALRVSPQGGTALRSQLADRLEAAGCAASKIGQDWLAAGDFDAAFMTPTTVDASGIDIKVAPESKREGLHVERGPLFHVTMDDFKFSALTMLVENNTGTMLRNLSCICKVRGGHGSGIEGRVVKQIKVPWINWDDQMDVNNQALGINEVVRLPLVGVSSNSTEQKTTFVVMAGMKAATRVSEPRNAVIFEFIISSEAAIYRNITLTPRGFNKDDVMLFDLDSQIVELKIEK